MVGSFAELSSDQKRVRLRIMGITILLFGLVAGYFTVLQPWWKSKAAQNWIATPCKIISGGIQDYQDRRGVKTYSINITYQYQIAGQAYQSSQYDFTFGSLNLKAGYEEIVQHYPSGMISVCYVNPRDNTDAVLSRGFQNIVWVPPFCLVVAIVILFFAARLK